MGLWDYGSMGPWDDGNRGYGTMGIGTMGLWKYTLWDYGKRDCETIGLWE